MSTVLIVTNEQDLAADLVVLELERRGVAVLRCNTERMPDWQLVVTPGRRWRLTDAHGRTASSESTSSVWWRRPEPPSDPAPAGASRQTAFAAQWQAALEALASVPGPRFVSSPAAIRAAEDKALQLATAARLGFRVPETVWTNHRPAAAELDCDEGLVAKPVLEIAGQALSEAALGHGVDYVRDALLAVRSAR